MKKIIILIFIAAILTLSACNNNYNTSSNNSSVSTNASSSTQDIQGTGMNLTQIQAGDYSSLTGTWTEVANGYNRHDENGFHWRVLPSVLSTLSVSSDKIVHNKGDVVIQGNTLTDNLGSHTLEFENNGDSLDAVNADFNNVINYWDVHFYPKGVVNDLKPDNGVKIDNTKNLIVIWYSDASYTEVFAQTNSSNSVTSEMKNSN